MAITPGTIALTATVVLELLKFAKEMREILGDDVTDEQIAEIWMRSSTRYKAALEAWRNAPSSPS